MKKFKYEWNALGGMVFFDDWTLSFQKDNVTRFVRICHAIDGKFKWKKNPPFNWFQTYRWHHKGAFFWSMFTIPYFAFGKVKYVPPENT